MLKDSIIERTRDFFTNGSKYLDFSLLNPQNDFKLEPYFKDMIKEFESLGIKITINSKIKNKI